MPRTTIAKKPIARKKPVPNPDEDDDECPVCLSDPSESPGATWEIFPCSHKVCSECFPRCNFCPVCRCGKDGELGSARQAREEEAARRAQPPTHRVAVFRGGFGHPLSPESLSIRVHGLPSGLLSAMPEILAQISAESSSSARPMSRGQRQQRASQLLRFGNGSFVIQDVLGRQIHRPSPR
jgi:hypothetical protein